MPHDLLLARLADKGVKGNLFHAVDQLYANATSVVRARVENAHSAPFAVRRGVAQGCPMSPFLYAVFIDSLLDDLTALGQAEGLDVGTDAWRRLLSGQAYADDLSAFAATPRGMQRIIDTVREHSLRWGWQINVRKTVVVIFGPASVRALHAATAFRWGNTVLQVQSSAKYLGVHMRADTSWRDQHAVAMQKGRAASIIYSPLMASHRLPVNLKLQVLTARVQPTMTYGMELWAPPPLPRRGGGDHPDPLDDTLRCARRLALGIHAGKHERAWVRAASVKRDVLESDCRVLPASSMSTLAHARFAERARASDSKAANARGADPLSEVFAARVPTAHAQDFMGAAVRSGLSDDDEWVVRANTGRALALAALDADSRSRYAAAGTDSAAPSLPNAALSVGVHVAAAEARLRRSTAQPHQPDATRSGRTICRTRPTPVHLNPVNVMLVPRERAPAYFEAPKAVVYPILCLRSSHLPCDVQSAFKEHYVRKRCRHCGDVVLTVPDCDLMTADELRWRHVQHLLTRCTSQCGGLAPRPLLSDLRDDLLDASTGYPAALQAVRSAFSFGDSARSARELCIEFMLDPVAACSAPLRIRLAHATLVASYITLVAASVSHPHNDGPLWRLQCIRPPAHTRLGHWLPERLRSDSPTCSRVTHASSLALSEDSADEVWLGASPAPPATLLPALCPPVRSGLAQMRMLRPMPVPVWRATR